jgi:hypothetical protein
VAVIVKVATIPKNRTKVEDIKTSDLKPYHAKKQEDPYIAAYLSADILPFTFVIGDGKKYNFENETFFNKPLKQNSNYTVFLRFFEDMKVNSTYTCHLRVYL